MRVLKGILKESAEYYKSVEKELIDRISVLPKGSVKKRTISNKVYYYLQFRKKGKVIHKYIGKAKPEKLIRQLKERSQLERDLKKVRRSLALLKKLKRRKKRK